MSLAKSESPTCRVTSSGLFAAKNMNKKQNPLPVIPCDNLCLSAQDSSREKHIKHLGEQMLLQHAHWAATGCFDSRGAADGYRIAMERAISQRSPAAVAFMEAERGLS